ncbi:hypothetical protein [Microbacterium sp. MM2322]|uniref:hypothetical protein n=1 Tax=Microbacterium sp. MM2322 TaxID=3157631 RepID=UPI0032D58D0D
MTPAPEDAAQPRRPDGVIELFVGQMLALFPLRIRGEFPPDVPPPSLRRIFPRSPAPGSRTGSGSRRPHGRARTYSVFVDGPGHGILTVGTYEVEVVILPLDVSTPPQATVFRIAAIRGRTVSLVGVVIDPQVDAPG